MSKVIVLFEMKPTKRRNEKIGFGCYAETAVSGV